MQDESVTENSSIEVKMLRWPLNYLWICCRPEGLQADVNFPLRRRVWTQPDGVSVGWHNIELFTSTRADRANYYVLASAWRSSYGCCI